LIIAFLDLLGFEWLMGYDLEAAFNNLNYFNQIIKTKIIDEMAHPEESYESISLRDFVRKSSVTSFKYMISISDSLIIGSEVPDLFIRQLCDFVSYAFIMSAEPFVKEFTDLKSVNDTLTYNTKNGTIEQRKECAFPLLFRGGISFGHVIFSPEFQINQYKVNNSGINVCGLDYLRAVKLEGTGKGPRLFCSQSFVNTLSTESKKAIRSISNREDEKVYELIWTYYAFEALSNSSNKRENISRCLNRTLLPPAINLYNYFKNDEKNKLHYEEMLKLIFRGAIKYAKDNAEDVDNIIDILKSKLIDIELQWDSYNVDDFLV